MEKAKTVIFFLVFLVVVVPCGGSEGFKYVKNYTSKDYDALSQNWSILQDRRGIIYAANQRGILEFDGVTWRTVKILNATARSMDIDEAGRTIYVGGINEFGYLEPDGEGTLTYVSLKNYLKEEDRTFTDVLQVHCSAGGVWFRTLTKLFLWHDGKPLPWNPEKKGGRFKAMFKWKGNVYVQEGLVGLKKVKDKSLLLKSENEIFTGNKIFMAEEYNDRQLLIGIMEKGFYLYDGTDVEEFPTEVDAYLREKKLYHGIRLYNGDFALATLRGGVLIIDNHGRLKRVFNKNTGLQSDNVKYIFEDTSGNLWLALGKGISKIVYGSPASFFDDRSGLNGEVRSVTRHQGRLFVGTASGLYQLESTSPGAISKFHPVPGISGNCWDLLSVRDSLLAATDRGVFLVDETYNAHPVIPQKIALVLTASKTVPGRVWVGTKTGVLSLRQKDGQWHTEDWLEGIGKEIRSMVEDDAGNLWLGPFTQGVIKMDPHGKVKKLDATHNLPDGEVYVTRAAGNVVFATLSGIYRFNKAAGIFVPDETMGKEFTDGMRGVFRLAEGQDKRIWFHSHLENFSAEPRKDAYDIKKISFIGFPRIQVDAIYPDRHLAWFVCSEALISYDTLAKQAPRQTFSALIRKVTTQEGKPVYNDLKSPDSLPVVLKYNERNLLAYAAAPFYDDESETEYRYFMEGYDDDWSGWTRDTIKDYTNLDAGQYTLHVKAKDVYGSESEEDTFSFRVLPPAHLTWWAFLIYAGAAVLVVFLIVKWRSWRLVKEKQRLEKIIEERTHEINQANAQLQHQNLQLEEQSEKLKEMDKVKSRFFANISHEFRTPLTLIMGPLDKIHSDCRDIGIKKQIDVVNRNARRLLKLINQLLDLSRFESGKMKVQAEQRDLIPFLKGLLEPFELAAARQRLNLAFHSREESIPLYMDPEKLEKIMGNLLSNAVKFTPPGGSITVSVEVIPRGAGESEPPCQPEGHVTISVKDTGAGIPPDQLAHIFDRFYQAGSTLEHHYKGSGIGLALVAELVDLHHGEIMVRSKEEGDDSGSEFILRFPLGKKHLVREEMAETRDRGEPLEEDEPPEASMLELESIEAVENRGAVETEEEKGEGVPEKEIVLVVEDNADLRYYIRSSLEPDYSVAEAKDGREGIEKARSLIPDLIISDIMMPEKDGYELCRDIKTDISTSHIPFILLTARASEEDVVQGLETGADDYITKPFNTRVLRARIKNLIDQRRLLQVNINRDMNWQQPRISLSRIDREFLDDLKAVIEKNMSDPDFNVEELSKRLYMSRATVYRKVLALIGGTPTDFIRSCRLKRAEQMLRDNYGSVTEVAFEVGFTSRAYFTKCFKEQFHKLPSDYFSAGSS